VKEGFSGKVGTIGRGKVAAHKNALESHQAEKQTPHKGEVAGKKKVPRAQCTTKPKDLL